MIKKTVANGSPAPQDRFTRVLNERFGRLIGKKVEALVRPAQDDEFYQQGMFGLKFEGMIAWVMQDPEGNGPGFLEIQEV